ncbi:MAG: response regulator [Planctomycetes bacterium]|nr:response regulator [Planctomycetota bacterium]
MSQSFRVLLVEDDDSLRVCLDEFLASQGWTVHATGFGTEAVQMCRQQRFDFSILDFHLPGMTGLEVFQQIAAIRPLPAILMSGLATLADAAAAQRAGFFTFLRKPLDLDRLRQALQLLIQHHFGGPLQVFVDPQAGRPCPPAGRRPGRVPTHQPHPAPRRHPRPPSGLS